jgi:diguanylate cyclase (GGDEF)-like protein
MSFGRRLALFFLLLVVVPMLALVSILLFVSEDARQGKADARLAAGLETALAVYDEALADGRAAARELGATPGLGEAIAAGDRATLTAEAGETLAGGAAAVEIEGAKRALLVRAGTEPAVAFGAIRLQSGSTPLGTILVSTTTAAEFVNDVKRLTRRELIVTDGDAPLASTVTSPKSLPEADETADVELAEGEYRARRQLLDPASDESILLLGPRKEGGALAVGRPALALLVLFMLLAGVFAFSLARELTRLHERVAAQAATDPLTGLWNRRQMDDFLAQEEERRRRYDREYSVLIVDVDEFKQINDRYGHPQGDAVLEQLARIIGNETRTIDSGIRYGGDEFALILAETGAAGAVVAAERLRRSVERAVFPIRGGELKVTISVGLATAPDDAVGAEALVGAADDALLTAKREGKNRVVSAIRQA